MMMQKGKREALDVQLGYAADRDGNGVVYARLRSTAGERLVRAAFQVKRLRGVDDREIGYGALTAVAVALRERGVETVDLALSDPALLEDLVTHRALPPPLVLPYVKLRCALNRFRSFAVGNGVEENDLAARARAEVAFHTAA